VRGGRLDAGAPVVGHWALTARGVTMARKVKTRGKRSAAAKDLQASRKAKTVRGGASMGPSNYEKKNVTTIKWGDVKL
jgi:hypothetical protein